MAIVGTYKEMSGKDYVTVNKEGTLQKLTKRNWFIRLVVQLRQLFRPWTIEQLIDIFDRGKSPFKV